MRTDPTPLFDLPILEESVELLAVELTPEEWADRATAASLLSHEATELERELREHAKDAKAEIVLVRAEAAKASEAVRNRSEARPVTVRTVADLDRGEAVEVRSDTGEAVSRRALTDDEAARARQRLLAFPSS